jgi:hypothetical protein
MFLAEKQKNVKERKEVFFFELSVFACRLLIKIHGHDEQFNIRLFQTKDYSVHDNVFDKVFTFLVL